MTQYPGGPPQDPYYGRPGSDPYAPPPQPSDPYFGQPPSDPYAQPPQGDPWYGQPQVDPYAQQAPGQAWQPQPPQQPQPYWPAEPPPGAPPPRSRSGGSTGAAIAGIFLVLLGVWFLFRDEVSVDIGRVWPVIAVALGVLMVLAAFMPRRGR